MEIEIMAVPTKKHPAIEAHLSTLTGVSRPKAILANTCTWCKKAALDFTDELSRKEYTISGMCQSCQDKTFGSFEE